MTDIPGLVGTVAGLVSLVGIVYLVGVWKGRVETKLGNIQDELREHSPAETALMARTLWDIYVVEALRSRPDLVEHGSSYRLKKEGEALISDELKEALNRFGTCKAGCSGWEIVRALGMDTISRMAEEKGLTIQQSIAILVTYAGSDELEMKA